MTRNSQAGTVAQILHRAEGVKVSLKGQKEEQGLEQIGTARVFGMDERIRTVDISFEDTGVAFTAPTFRYALYRVYGNGYARERVLAFSVSYLERVSEMGSGLPGMVQVLAGRLEWAGSVTPLLINFQVSAFISVFYSVSASVSAQFFEQMVIRISSILTGWDRDQVLGGDEG